VGFFVSFVFSLCLFVVDRITFCVFGVCRLVPQYFSDWASKIIVCLELTVPLQLIVWKTRLQNYLFCLELDVKLLSHSLIYEYKFWVLAVIPWLHL